MSIWQSLDLPDDGHVREVSYGPDRGAVGGLVDVASAIPWYGGDGLRLSVIEPGDEPSEASVVIDREMATAMRDVISGWLDATIDEAG